MTAPGFSITGIDRSDYMAIDMPRAIAFYRDVLSLEPESSNPEGTVVEYGLPDGSTFGLWTGDDATPVTPFQPGNGVMFGVDDLAAAEAALTARGIEIIVKHDTPFCTFVLIHDSEGNTVTLHKRKR
jgi:predicted enzyme related to lactoylglutathione lyase